MLVILDNVIVNYCLNVRKIKLCVRACTLVFSVVEGGSGGLGGSVLYYYSGYTFV